VVTAAWPGLAPGDIWAVDAGGFGRPFIMLGARLAGHPAPVDHVVMAHHADKRGVWWGIEGRPGGVGWVQMDRYLTGPLARHASSNAAQPRTTAQRHALCTIGEGLLSTGYDWVGGIAADMALAFHGLELARLLDHWWGWRDGVARPPHVVCSSAWAWAYGKVGLARPAGGAELVTPADWWAFNQARSWPG
jgi:hypothetical protein